MKKVFLPIAIAATLLLGGNTASAEAPTWYNFQGVCAENSAEVTVEFTIVNEFDAVIYAETQTVKTNAKGAFTCHVGEGEVVEGAMPEAPQLKAGGLSLITKVNGVELSKAAFGAVPYASSAAAVGEFTADDIATLYDGLDFAIETASAAQEELRMKADAGLVDQIKTIVVEQIGDEGLVHQAITSLSTAVNQIEETYVTKADIDNYDENITNKFNELEQTFVTKADIENYDENVANKFSEIETTFVSNESMDNFNENLTNKFNEIEATYVTKESMDNFNENVTNKFNEIETSYVSNESMDNFNENLTNKFNEIEATYVTKESMDNFNENVANKFNEIETTFVSNESMDNFNENITRGLAEPLEALSEQIITLDDALAIVSSDVSALTESLRGKADANLVDQLSTIVVEQIGDEGQIVRTITMLTNAINTIESDIQELQAKINDLKAAN